MANFRVVGAGDSISWYKGGWGIFTANVVNWLLMTLILVGITIVLSFIPFIGPVVLYVLLPIFLGGMLYSAQKLDQGKSAEIMDIFVLFKDQQRLTPLIILGLLMLAVGFVTAMIIGGLMFASLGPMTNTNGAMPVFPSIGLGTLAISLAFSILSAMLFIFATPLIVFKNMSATDAVKHSFMATAKNFPAFALFMLIAFILAIVAIIPFGLGLLVLTPLMIAATYVGYKNIFA